MTKHDQVTMIKEFIAPSHKDIIIFDNMLEFQTIQLEEGACYFVTDTQIYLSAPEVVFIYESDKEGIRAFMKALK